MFQLMASEAKSCSIEHDKQLSRSAEEDEETDVEILDVSCGDLGMLRYLDDYYVGGKQILE